MKHARDMDEVERAAALQELIRGARPVPPPIITEADETPLIRGSSSLSLPPTAAAPKPKLAKEMSPIEQDEWLKEHKRRFQ
jgi:hypothetical protein